jgi:hypothetical protein
LLIFSKKNIPANALKEMLLTVTILTLTVGPLWLVTRDLFDGASVAYAHLTGHTDGLENWLSQSNWLVAIYFYKLVFAVTTNGHMPYWLVMKVFLTLIVFGLFYEFDRLAANLFALERQEAHLLALLCVASPSLYTLVSSAIIPIAFCIWVAFLGHRLFWSESLGIRLLGLALITVSFQLNSSLVFVLALDVVYLYRFIDRRKQRVPWFCMLLLLAITVYITMRLFAPPQQIFVEYNHLLNPFNPSDMMRIIKATVMFMTWAIIPMAGMGLIWITSKLNQNLSVDVSLSEMIKACLSWQVLWLLFLCAAAAFPYVMVGKGAPLFTLTSVGSGLTEQVLRSSYVGPFAPTWANTSGRHALFFAVPLTMLTWFLCAQLKNRITKKTPSRGSINLLLLLSPLFLFWVIGSFANKLQHQTTEISLLNALKQIAPAPPGVIEIKYSPGSDWLIWSTSAGVLLQQAWGSSHYFGMFYSLDFYRDDMQWQYHAYLRQTGGLHSQLIQNYLAMSDFPGEQCTTRYLAEIPKQSWYWFSGIFPEKVAAARIDKVGTVCNPKYIMPNPTPQKVLIP